MAIYRIQRKLYATQDREPTTPQNMKPENYKGASETLKNVPNINGEVKTKVSEFQKNAETALQQLNTGAPGINTTSMQAAPPMI